MPGSIARKQHSLMEIVGIQLLADGGDKYLATLTATAAAETKLMSAAQAAVSGINALDDSQAASARSAQLLAQRSQTAGAGATRLASAAGSAAGDVAGLGDAAETAAKDVGGLGQQSKQGGKEAEGLGDKSEKGARGLDRLKQAAFGAALEVGATLVDAAMEAGQAIVQFVGESISKAGDFEAGMNRFASVTGSALDESGQSLEDFKDLFISLGRELPVSTADVQQAAIEMAKGGIEPATIAAGGLRDVLNLAAAGEIGIAEAAEIASKQLGVWVDSAADATTKAQFLTEASDLLAQAANASTVDVDELALGLANTGKSADIAGLSFRETVTSMALISSGFSSAADAGTSFKTFLQRLTPTTDSQAEAFKALNLLTSEGTSKFYDATGSFIGMDKAAELLKNSLDGMSDSQRKMALEAAFGSDAIRAAGMLADAGAAGYQRMAADMAKAGTAAQQAAKRQQGFNVAMDNAMGSLEALQLTVASAALPALTSLLNLLASGINAMTDYADATLKGETALAAVAGTVQTLAIPAMFGLSAALTAYALVQAVQATPAIFASIPALIAQTSAFVANATAVMAAAAPYAAIALAIGGVTLAIQDFNSKLDTATTNLLESRDWWNASTEAITRYDAAVGASKDRLAPYATEIANIRNQLQEETRSLGERMAMGMVSDAQRDQEMAHINALAGALDGATQRYTAQEQALIKTTAASMTATAQAAILGTAEQALSNQTSLTTADIEKLGKQIEDTFAKGQETITTYAQNYSTFATGVEERSAAFADQIAKLEQQKQDTTSAEQKRGIDDQIAQARAAYAEQEGAAAQSYANQQTAQRAHLGQLLIDYTVAQAQLGNIAKDKAAEITAALEQEYGLQESSTATTFLNMAQAVDDYASSSGGSITDLIGDLRSNEDAAKQTQQAMESYAKEYVATQANNFANGKSDAENYIRSLERIPRNVTTTVTTRYVSEGRRQGGDQGDDPPGRATGGAVAAMERYLVGEQGPELFTPSTSGYITPTDALARAMASTAQLASSSHSTTTTNQYSGNTYNMPIYTNQGPAVLQQSLALVEAMSR